MIIDHTHPEYTKQGGSRLNGARFYSEEIVANIIPHVNTDRHWITIRAGEKAADHSIYFIHNNLNPGRYAFLKKYNDVILVCGIPETCDKVKEYGTPIYLPLSIDLDYVRQFKTKIKTKHAAFAGRINKVKGCRLPSGTATLHGLPREKLLKEMAEYAYIYAVGRTALEAKALGCRILPYDPRFPDPSFWQLVDNKDAAKLLQQELDRIDGI